MAGPAYRSTLKDEAVGNSYINLTDDWGNKIEQANIDQVVVIVSQAIGNEAQLRFWKDDHPGPPLPLLAGINARTDQARYGYNGVDFRNALAGSVAAVHVDVTGIPSNTGQAGI